MSEAFLGVGIAFPAAAADGHLATAAYEESVRESILIILQTNRGERVMRPGFGAGLHDFVFEPVNTTTLALVKTRVQEALVDFEPRIQVSSVDVKTSDELNKILIDIRYVIRASNTASNLVYPFFLQEGSAR